MTGEKVSNETQARKFSKQFAGENDIAKIERHLEEAIENNEHFISILTDRERQVLKFIVQGMTNREIAGELSIVKRTVEYHRGRIMERLGVENFAELMMLVFSKSLVGSEF